MCESECKIFRLDSIERPEPSFNLFEFDETMVTSASLSGVSFTSFPPELISLAFSILVPSNHFLRDNLSQKGNFFLCADGVESTSNAASCNVAQFFTLKSSSSSSILSELPPLFVPQISWTCIVPKWSSHN